MVSLTDEAVDGDATLGAGESEGAGSDIGGVY